MGRGTSPGGKSGNSLPPVTNTVTPPTPQQVAKGNVLPKGGIPFSDFQNMTDDEKADVVSKALSTGVPMFLDDSGMQRFAYFTGMSDKPTVVSDAQLDSMPGTEAFRSMNDAYSSSKDLGYSSRDIADQIMNGDFTMYSDSGGSVHGRAIYFADNYHDASLYGTGRNPVTMRVKISGNGISESAANRMYRNAYSSGDKLAMACSKAGSTDAANLYALAKGYDYTKADYGGYHMVLNRKCLTASNTVKPTNYGGRSW